MEALVAAAGVVGDSFKTLDLAADYLLVKLQRAASNDNATPRLFVSIAYRRSYCASLHTHGPFYLRLVCVVQLQLEEASALLESLCMDGRSRASGLAAVLPRVFVPQTAHLLADRHIKGFGADKATLIQTMVSGASYPLCTRDTYL